MSFRQRGRDVTEFFVRLVAATWRRAVRRFKWLQPRLVIFFVRLPEPVPIPHGAIFSFSSVDEYWAELEGAAVAQAEGHEPIEWPGHPFVSLRFWTAERELAEADKRELGAVFEVMRGVLPAHLFTPDEEPDEDSEIPESLRALDEDEGEPPVDYVTVVEAVAVLPPPRRMKETTLSDSFDRCLARAADIVHAYRRHTGTPLRRLTFERLPFSVPYATRSLFQPYEWDGPGLMLLHFKIDVAEDPLPKHEVDAVMGHLEVGSRGHPFALFADRSVDARVALERDGEYGEALIQLQIAAEILFDNLLALLLWEEGVSAEVAAHTVFDGGLTTRVKKHYAPRLGGNWSLAGAGAVARWAQEIHAIRGRVVHAGYHATAEEARRGAAAAAALENFTKDRVAARRTTYPRTTLLFVGKPGLERMNLWAGQIRRFAERADEEPDWIVSFRNWRRELDAARVT